MYYEKKQSFLINFIKELNTTEIIILIVCLLILIIIITYKIRIELKARYYTNIKKRMKEIEEKEQKKEPKK